MIQGRDSQYTPVQISEQALHELFTHIPSHDIEQFYAAFQLWSKGQQLQALGEEIAQVKQNIATNSAQMQAVAPSTIALAALVQLQACGVEDVDLLDRMLERGDEWLDHTMQLLQRCEQLNMLDEGYTRWCEHALEGAYDWIGSMQEQESTLSPATTLPPTDTTTTADEQASTPVEETDEPDDTSIVTEDQLLRKLMSEDGEEVSFTENTTTSNETEEAPTEEVAPTEEAPEPVIEAAMPEEQEAPTSEQALKPKITQPLPTIHQQQTARVTQPLPVMALTEDNQTESETFPIDMENNVEATQDTESAPVQHDAAEKDEVTPAPDTSTSEANSVAEVLENDDTSLNLPETEETEETEHDDVAELSPSDAEISEHDLLTATQAEASPQDLPAAEETEQSSTPVETAESEHEKQSEVSTETLDADFIEPDQMHTTTSEIVDDASSPELASTEYNDQNTPAAAESVEEESVNETQAYEEESLQWPYVYPEVKEAELQQSAEAVPMSEETPDREEKIEQPVPVTVGGGAQTESMASKDRSTEPRQPETKKQRGLLQRSLAKLLGR